MTHTSPLKVGRKIPSTKIVFQYKDVDFDLDGWADATKYRPVDFDLVLLQIEGREKPISGWAVGNTWDSVRMKDKDIVLTWKRKREFSSEYEQD